MNDSLRLKVATMPHIYTFCSLIGPFQSNNTVGTYVSCWPWAVILEVKLGFFAYANKMFVRANSVRCWLCLLIHLHTVRPLLRLILNPNDEKINKSENPLIDFMYTALHSDRPQGLRDWSHFNTVNSIVICSGCYCKDAAQREMFWLTNSSAQS